MYDDNDQAVVGLEEEGPKNLMDQLRAKRQEVSDTVDTLIPIQIYDGKVGDDNIPQILVKYRIIERQEVEEIGRKVRKQTRDRGEQMMRILVDTLVAACEGFYVKPEGAVDPEELVWPVDNRQVSDWTDMAKFLGYDSNGRQIGSRDAVMYVFGDKEFSVGQHAFALNRWLNNVGVKIDEEFLGEG